MRSDDDQPHLVFLCHLLDEGSRATYCRFRVLLQKNADGVLNSAVFEQAEEFSFMSKPWPFKWRHIEAEIILLYVRWYLRVRHVTQNSIPSETERTGRRFFGSRAYLKPKG